MLLINDDLEYSVFLPRSEKTLKWLDSHFEYYLDYDEYDPETMFVTFFNSEDVLTAIECCYYSNLLVH